MTPAATPYRQDTTVYGGSAVVGQARKKGLIRRQRPHFS